MQPPTRSGLLLASCVLPLSSFILRKEVLMGFWNDPRLREVLRQVAIALLLALLSVLGYDQAVAKRW